MRNRFEQSAPPSIDKIYRSLPIGPFGVSPFIYSRRNRRTDGEIGVVGLARRSAGFAKAVRSTLPRWASGDRGYTDVILPACQAACPPRP